jgi:hypothetical protein
MKMMKYTDNFIRQVKFNCNISDAKFWGYYSICGLLMRYRDLYRSEQSLLPWDSIANEEISNWIQARETLWNTLEGKDLQPILINGRSFDPFDIDDINAALQDAHLIYGAGYGTFNKPTFFVAQLDRTEEIFDYRVYTAGREICRDLAAAPAMLQGRCIYLRPDVISAFLWDRFEELHSNRQGCFAGEVFSMYKIRREDSRSAELFKRIRNMTSDASSIVLLHEAGEAYEDAYSEEWHEILGCGCDKATELYLRAIKDIIADTSEIGPLINIIKDKDIRSLYLFIMLMDGIRRGIFPEIRDNFQAHVKSDSWAGLEKIRKAGYKRACMLQSEIIGIWRKNRDKSELAGCIRDIIKKHMNST